MRLGEIATLELVKLYMKHECLWNTNHPDYRIKEKRSEAYGNMVVLLEQAANIKMDMTELKTKICHLRNTYTQEIKKIIKRSTDPHNMYKPSLPWFSVMDSGLKNLKCVKSTLEDVIAPTATDQLPEYWPETSLENTEENGIHNDNPLSEDGEEEVGDDFANDADDDYVPDRKIKVEPERDSIYNNLRMKRKRKNKHKSRDKSTEKVNDNNFADLVGHLASADTVPEDEYDIYGRYVASQLRKMAPSKAIKIQLELHRLVCEARLKEIT